MAKQYPISSSNFEPLVCPPSGHIGSIWLVFGGLHAFDCESVGGEARTKILKPLWYVASAYYGGVCEFAGCAHFRLGECLLKNFNSPNSQKSEIVISHVNLHT